MVGLKDIEIYHKTKDWTNVNPIDELTHGIDGDNKDIINEKLLSYTTDQINELKNMSEKERQH